MNIQITSGTGPHECELAVKYTVEEFLKEFVGSNIIAYNEIAQNQWQSAMMEIPDEKVTEDFPFGTILWNFQSPLRKNWKRKNWFVRASKIPDEKEISADGEIKVQYFHSGGNGGQNVNKVETGVRLIHVPTGITTFSTDERSQLMNRHKALERLLREIEKQNISLKAEHKKNSWLEHYALERGNAVRKYKR